MKEACVTVHIVHTSDVDNHMLDAIHTLGVEIHSSDVIPYARRRFYELGFRVVWDSGCRVQSSGFRITARVL